MSDEERKALGTALYLLRNDLRHAEAIEAETRAAIAVIERKLKQPEPTE